MSINGKLQDGSMEIDAGNNLETFKMGSGAEEAIEVNDFQNVSMSHAFRELEQARPPGAFPVQREASLTHIPTVMGSHGRFSLRKGCSLFLIFSKWKKKHNTLALKGQFLELYEVLAETHARAISFHAVIHNTVMRSHTIREEQTLFMNL